MTRLRTTSSPSVGAGTSTSASSKSVGFGSPTGRAASRISRPFMDVLPSCGGEVGSALGQEGGDSLGVLLAGPGLRVEREHVGVLVEATAVCPVDQVLSCGERDACPLREGRGEVIGAGLDVASVKHLVDQ